MDDVAGLAVGLPSPAEGLLPPPGASLLSDVTLALGIIGTVLSIISLSWQFYAWRHSGPVVVVTTFYGLPVGRLQGLLPPGDQFVIVTAHNTGRAPIQITGWGLETPDGGSLVLPDPFPISDRLPFTLNQQAQGNWHISSSNVEENCAAIGINIADLRAMVRLGDGRTAYAKKRGIGRSARVR